MQLDKALDQGKTETGTLTARSRVMTDESVEDLSEDICRYAAPMILHDKLDRLILALADNINDAVFLGITNRVGNQVIENLAKALFIGHHDADIVRNIRTQIDPRFGQTVLQAFNGSRNSCGDIHLAQIQLHDTRIQRCQIKNVIDDGKKGRGRGTDIVGIFALLV